jgi:hypothetical protein
MFVYPEGSTPSGLSGCHFVRSASESESEEIPSSHNHIRLWDMRHICGRINLVEFVQAGFLKSAFQPLVIFDQNLHCDGKIMTELFVS